MGNDGSTRDGNYGRSHEAALSQLRDDPELRVDALQQIEEAATRLVSVVDHLLSVLASESQGLSELFLERTQALQSDARR